MNNRGMGHVFQPTYTVCEADGSKVKKTAATWWIKFSVHGRSVKENAHTTNRAAAVRLLKKRIGQAANGVPVGPQIERTTLADVLQMVEDDYSANGRRTLNRVRAAVAHLKEFFGASKAHVLTADRITAYQAQRLKQGATASTVNYEVAMLRRGFRLGSRAGKVAVRPEMQMLHVENARKGFFEPDQFRAVLKHLPVHLRCLARAAYITGWRRGELISRQWRHVDMANGWLRLEPGESKNGEGRQFPFTSELRAVLQEQREWVRVLERETEKIIPWVFCRPDGERIGDFRKAWATACKAAGVPGRLVHDFRRTAVRNLERAGVPRSAAMKLTGHKTEAVYRRYAITDSAMLQEAAAKLDALHAAEANGPSSVQVTSISGVAQ